MRKVETLSPFAGNLRPTKNVFREGVKMLGIRARWNDGGEGAPEPTPLPEGFSGGEGFDPEIKTVEGLRDAYNGVKSRTFMDYLGDDAKNDPAITRYKKGEEFYKGFKAQSELVGKKGIIIPDENSDDGVKSAYRKAMGIPDNAEGYTIPELEGLHPEVKITPEGTAALKTIAEKYGLSVKQAEGVFGEYLTTMSNALNKNDENNVLMKNEAETALRGEWGKDFDENSTIARRLVEKFGGKEAIEAFGELGNKPAVMKFLSNLGKTISEDSFVGVGSIDLSTDATGAKQRIKEIAADPAYLNQSDPRHKALVDENTRLFKIAYPSE